MGEPKVRVILNPTAASGRALGKARAIEAALRRYDLTSEIVLTRARGHAAELARAAASDGVDVVAIAGGDGTIHEVMQAYVSPAGEAVAGPDLALLPCGTGADFSRSFGMSGALDEAVARIRHGARRRVDLGVLRYVDHNGADAVCAFVNVAGFGLAGQVDAAVHGTPKWLGGRASAVVGTLRALASYKNASVRVKIDGAAWHEGPMVTLAIANGRYFGGGMMIAPHADLTDGRLEVVMLGDLRRRELLGLTAKIYRGAHLAADGVRAGSGAAVEAEAVHPWATVLVDVDGEQPGKLPIRASLVKGALTFRM